MASVTTTGKETVRLTPRARWAIERASDAFERLLGPEGYAPCPEHGVDYTGKTARAIVLNCALAADAENDPYFDRAVRVARTIIGRLGQDDAADGAWVFNPNRRQPHRVSTKLVDCGESVDALATLLEVAGDRLPDIDRARIEEAIRLCAATYLLPTVPGAPIISERLCGAMGLAGAAAVLDEPGWADTVREAIAGALGEMRPDGSFPYVTDATAIAAHQGVSDLTICDHGRILAFARYALTRIGDGGSHADELRQGVDFLIDVLRPDGVKPLALDGRRWCWDADTEAGSAPCDAYALATDGRPTALRLAGIVAARSAQTLGPDGLVDACPTGATAVSRIANTADLAWLARAHESAELDDLPTNPPPPKPAPPVHHADAGVVRLQTRRACAILRVRKQPTNGLVGARIGGGGLVYVGDAERGWANALEHVCEPWMPEGAWFIHSTTQPGSVPLDAGARFRLRLARMHWRAGRRWYAVRMLYRFLGPPAWAAAGQFASIHALDGEVTLEADGILIASCLARADGQPHPALRTERRYRWNGDRLLVSDAVSVAHPITGLAYRYPKAIKWFEVEAPTSWRVEDNQVRFGPLGAGVAASIRYEI